LPARLARAQVLAIAAVVPPGDGGSAKLEKADVPIGLGVAKLDVGVEVDVVARAHLAGIVDLEARGAGGELNPA
jgi:hypothetical protein